MEDNLNTAEKTALGAVTGAAAATLAASVWEDVAKFAKEHPVRAAIDAMCGLVPLVIDAEVAAHKKK